MNKNGSTDRCELSGLPLAARDTAPVQGLAPLEGREGRDAVAVLGREAVGSVRFVSSK